MKSLITSTQQFSGIWRRRQMLILAIILAFAAALPAYQGLHPVSGRQIAQVMGIGGASWLERNEREAEENVDGALDELTARGFLKTGMTAAEVGAGTGYVALRIAKRVGPSGKVYGNDIQPQMLDLFKQNAAKAGLKNTETILGSVSDPKLPAAQMDIIVLVDVYHEFSEPQKMLAGIRGALKPTGKLVQFEYRKEDPAVPIREDHKMSVAVAKKEVEAEGFHLEQVIEALPRQHILVYSKNIQ